MSADNRAYWFCVIRNDAGQNVLVRRTRYMTPSKGFHRYEAECSCGWRTRTGGAIPAAIQRDINAHNAAAHAHPASPAVTA